MIKNHIDQLIFNQVADLKNILKKPKTQSRYFLDNPRTLENILALSLFRDRFEFFSPT